MPPLARIKPAARWVGFTKIHVEELAPLRPFKHNEYDRFLVQAYPYYTGIFSTMGGFVIFSVALLYSKF